jgi:hypothetical protein
MDYITVAVHLPLTTYHVLSHVWQLVVALPWPSAAQVFGAVATYMALFPVRLLTSVVFPERRIARSVRKKVYKRHASLSRTHSDQLGAASIGGLFHHF